MFIDYENKMVSKMNYIQIKNTSDVVLNGVKPGQSVSIQTDSNGTPLDRYWRNRLRDSVIDNCVEIVRDQSEDKVFRSNKAKKEAE